MNSLTIFLKQLRLKNNNERLSDMAKRLGISASYLSSIETNKRKLNNKLFEKIKNEYNLTSREVNELDILRNLAAKELSVSLQDMDDERKETLVKFLSNVDELSTEDFKKINLLFKKSDEEGDK